MLEPQDLILGYLMEIISQSRPAKFRKAVYLAVDAKFYPYGMFVANQLAEQNPNRDFDICILSKDTLPDHSLVDELDLRLCRLDVGDLESKLPTDSRISFAAYLRIFAPRIFENDYNRMLYLDSDMFIRRGNISKLLDLDIANFAVAAVRDMNQLRKRGRVSADYVPLGLSYSKYFNSGFMLIDVTNYNQQNISERAIEFVIKNETKILQHDQTALNAILHGDWAELSINWNYLYSHQTAYFAGFFDPAIIHFVGRRKAWSGQYNGYSRFYTEQYRKFFEQNFPELNIKIQDGLFSDKNYKYWHILSLLFHLVNFHRFLPNDDYWLSDWDVK